MARTFQLVKDPEKATELLDGLNGPQRSAAEIIDGPLLILAGAGSGKTRVMTHRIAHMILNHHVPPHRILAVTFTNKAAAEMRERVQSLLDTHHHTAGMPTLSTFHSLCARLLRREAENVGLNSRFVIYDDKDQLSLIKQLMDDEDMGRDSTEARRLRGFIEAQKHAARTPDQAFEIAFDQQAEDDASFFAFYQSALKRANCVDFGDLINLMLQLFREDPKKAEQYSHRFEYVMVDEFQDTNPAQYELLRHFTSAHKNLAVVGDDDQAIYRWRGATVANILNFEENYPEAKVVKLEQNYRSSQTILDAANDVIQYNEDRREKKLWTDRAGGELLTLFTGTDDREEATFVVQQIEERAKENSYDDFAIFYRTNAQARAFEEQLRYFGVPYTVVGGVSFYAREEIKDILAYLKVAMNPANEVDLMRVINKPSRSIGKTSVEKIREFAAITQSTMWNAIGQIAGLEEQRFDLIPVERPKFGPKQVKGIKAFAHLIIGIQEQLTDDRALIEIVNYILVQTDYFMFLAKHDPERAEDKQQNLEELMNAMVDFERDHQAENSTTLVQQFLEKSALLASVDQVDMGRGAVTLMTIHASKGLEFDVVFLAGMEDEVFPSQRSKGDEAAISEERRLAYVAITRARQKLFISNAKRRRVRGMFKDTTLSRFVRDIDESRIELDPRSAFRPTRRVNRQPRNDYRPLGSGVPQSEWEFDQSPPMYKNQIKNARKNYKPDDPDLEFSQDVPDQEIVYDMHADVPVETVDSVFLGKTVSHSRFGIGEIVESSGVGEKAILTIRFVTEAEPIKIVRKWVKVLG